MAININKMYSALIIGDAMASKTYRLWSGSWRASIRCGIIVIPSVPKEKCSVATDSRGSDLLEGWWWLEKAFLKDV